MNRFTIYELLAIINNVYLLFSVNITYIFVNVKTVNITVILTYTAYCDSTVFGV